jgi:TonB family protein
MRTKAGIPVVALAVMLAMAAGGRQLQAQSNSPAEAKRPVKHLVTPQFPDLAKRLNLTGTVRIEVTIGPDGTVRRTRVIGGHPLLAAEAEHAAQKSTFEPGPRETFEVIEFKF